MEQPKVTYTCAQCGVVYAESSDGLPCWLVDRRPGHTERVFCSEACYNLMKEYDLLVEQTDQELALNGCVSPFTQLQLDACAAGHPIPHIDVGAIVRSVMSGRRDPEDVWFDD